jgi:hypothetical protein
VKSTTPPLGIAVLGNYWLRERATRRSCDE